MSEGQAAPGAGLMAGKRGLVMGVANDHSIAWGMARALHAQGAELAFTYQGEAFQRRVEPLAKSLGARHVLPCNVEDLATVDAVFDALKADWGSLDFVVHAIAYSDKEELKGRYLDTTPGNFARTLFISCYSFTAVAKRAAAMMPKGGSLITLTFSGAERVMPHYNIMGVAKAALEASVRYLAEDLGKDGIRVNAVSAGPVRTLAGSAIAGARQVFNWTEQNAPLRHSVSLEELGGSAVYLLSGLSAGVTGEIHYVDAGYNIIAVPNEPIV
jgi:enoyl-[acyl-carrier protein] reductase I